MNRLIIKLNNGTRETVVSSVIKKLYDLAKEIELDANGTIALKGWLYTSATYLDYITYLENISKINGEPLLIIDVGKAYITFADPEVQRVLVSRFGDGTGVTISNLSSVSLLPAGIFDYNTTIETFNELGLFTNITSMSYDCFRGCTNLRSIDLSNILEFSSGNALNGCSKLGSDNNGILNLPKLNSTLGGSCLASCTSLVEVNIGSSVSSGNKISLIKNSTFGSCTNLEKVTGLSEVTSLEGGVFYDCIKLKNLPDLNNSTALSIGDECFFDCLALKCIDLISLTTSLVGKNHFYRCENLIDLSTNDYTQASSAAATYTFNWSTIPNGVFWGAAITNKSFIFPNATSIGNRSFVLSNVVSVSAPNATTAGPYGFYSCRSLQSVDFPNLIETTVEDGMQSNELFRECTSLEYLYFPSLTATSFSQQCWGCTNLKLYIAPNLTDIGRIVNFCGNCTNLKGIFIPKASVGSMITDLWHWDSSIIGGASNLKVFDVGNVTKINNFTVYGKTSMAFIIRNSTTIPTLSNETDLSFLNVTFYVDDNLLSTYQADSAWSNSNIHLDVISNFVLSDYFDSDTLALYNSIVNPS